MSDPVVIEQADEPEQALEVYHAAPPATLFRTDDPGEVVARATATADALMAAIHAHDARHTDPQKRLISDIKGKKYPKVEAWTLLGTMLGVFPVCVWTRKLEDGWEARVEARTLAGDVIGAAEAECVRSESNWRTRDDNALRSMAQTRATSKALRQPLGFVVTLAGLEATPSEEMPADRPPARQTTVPAAAPPPAQAAQPRKPNPRRIQKIGVLRSKLAAAGVLSEERYKAELARVYHVESTNDLTDEQCSRLIDQLSALEADVPPEPTGDAA